MTVVKKRITKDERYQRARQLDGQGRPGVSKDEPADAFLSNVFDYRQSEFLQLATFVILATYFIYRGSPQSRDGSDEMAEDIKPIREKLDA